jgi:hypothetical protein
MLLAGPTALAFFSGGYFDGPRAWAGLLAWLAVVVGVLAGAPLLPRYRGSRLALAGLAGLAAWTLLSMLWAPVVGNAYHAGQIAMLYLGTLLAATMLLRGEATQRLVEPALAAGALIVIGYGLSERLLPGVLHFARSVSAEGRLEQPLTYWNAVGELAALGFVLSARVAGDAVRPAGLRAAAAAACAPLGMGLYISFSRGALFAAVAGMISLVLLAPRREQLTAAALAIGAGALAAVAAAPWHGVTGLAGSLATRERQGAITLALLVVIALAAAGIGLLLARRDWATGAISLPRGVPWIAGALICAGLAIAIVLGSKETSAASQPLPGGATRLVTLQSNRYDYWGVALRAFAHSPVHGVGAGGWSVYWLRWRTVNEYAQDAHSLELQTLAELGVVGAALLLACFGGLALAARRALDSPLTGAGGAGPVAVGAVAVGAGPVAALVTYLAHSPLDWDWQMPAVTLVAVVLAGWVLATAEFRAPRRSAAPRE